MGRAELGDGQPLGLGRQSAVGPDQLERLDRLLLCASTAGRLLVTHYSVARPGGKAEHPGRQPRPRRPDRRGGVCLWLHGHIHEPYHHPRTALAPFPIICAGSATQSGHWSYGEYVVQGSRLKASRRVFDPDAGGFREGEAFELDLPCPAPRAVAAPPAREAGAI
ncbi:MAG: hypothetical protein U0797_04215 [Gemmataceae bacterium]